METKKFGKNDFIAIAMAADKEAGKIREEIEAEKSRYSRLSVLYGSEIKTLQMEADLLSRQFRNLYAQASAAYNSNQKALAKNLSSQGRAIQAECESLNRLANSKRNELAQILENLELLRGKLSELKSSSAGYMRKSEEFRGTHVVNFEASGTIKDFEVEEFLDQLPQRVFEKIKFVTFVDEGLFQQEGKLRIPALGATFWGTDGTATIRVGRQPYKDAEGNRKAILATLGHEIGHVVHEKFLTEDQKATWFGWHTEANRWISKYAILDDVEDFCEWFRFYKSDSKMLEDFDKKQYNFIKGVHREMEKET